MDDGAPRRPPTASMTAAEQRVQRDMSREFAIEEIKRLQDRILGIEREIGELQRQVAAQRSQIGAAESQVARAAASGPTNADLTRIEQRIQAVEQAHARDRDQIVQAAGKAAANEVQKALAAAAPRGSSGASSAGRYKNYTVAAGDNLSLIAEAFKTNVAELMRLNGLTDPNQLRIGQVLKVPAS